VFFEGAGVTGDPPWGGVGSGDVEMEEMGRQAGVECAAAVAIDMNAVTLAAEVDGGVTLIDRHRDSRLLQTLRQA